MAKTFLTNINLKGNQLLNAVIQSASSAPSAYAAGQLYFNTSDSIFYYSTDAGTGSWVPVGVQYISSVGSNLSVSNGELNVSSDPSFNTVHATSNNQGENFKVGDDAWIGDINQQNTFNVKGVEDPTQAYISFGVNGSGQNGAPGKQNWIGSDSSDFFVNSTTGNIVLNPDGGAYIGSVSAGNQIVTTAGTQTLSNKTISDELHFNNGLNEGFIAGQSGTLVINANNALSTTSDGDTTITTTVGDIVLNPDGYLYRGSKSDENKLVTVGDLPSLELHLEGTTDQITVSVDGSNGYTQISLPSYINISNGEIHIRKNEYWKDGTQYGIVTANPSSGNFTISAVNRKLELESTNDDVVLNPGSGVIQALGKELHITKTEYHLSDNTNRGAILAHPSDGSLTVAATGWLNLESHNGNIALNSDSNVVLFNNNLNINGSAGTISTDNGSLHLTADNGVVTTDQNELHTPKVELWQGGDTSGTNRGAILAHPSDGSLTVAATGWLHLESHDGDINLSPSSGTIDASNSQIILQKTEYWRSGDQQGVVAAQSDGSLRLTATGGELQLESNGNNVRINSGSGTTYFNNNVYINSEGEIGTGSGALSLQPDNSYIYANGTLDVESHKIVNLLTPEYANDAANKAYVDAVAQGIRIKQSVDTATTSSLDGTYAAGSADVSGGLGIGATFTLTTAGDLATSTGDSVELNDRILVRAQYDEKQNGIYTVTSMSPMVLTRATDSDNSSSAELRYGNFYYVSAGTLIGTAWVLSNEGTGTAEDIKIGTDSVEFTQFAGAGAYSANHGVKLDGNTFQLNPDSAGGLTTDATYASIKLRTDSGLSTTNDGLAVNAGTGILVSDSHVSVDETVIATRTYADGAASGAVTTANGYTDTAIAALSYVGTIDGDNTTTSFPITHNLGTRAVNVRVYQVSSTPDTQYAEVETDVIHTDANTVTIAFAAAPANTTVYEVSIVK